MSPVYGGHHTLCNAVPPAVGIHESYLSGAVEWVIKW